MTCATKTFGPKCAAAGYQPQALLAVATARAPTPITAPDASAASNARLVAMTGLSLRQVQRADEALRLPRCRHRGTRASTHTTERMPAGVGDRARGWASVWALHDNPPDLRHNAFRDTPTR